MSHHKPYIIGAGQPTLDDVLHVIIGQDIVLDAAACDRIKKDSPLPKNFESELTPNQPQEAPEVVLSPLQTRAALVFKLNSLINGKSKCRLAIVQFLEYLINSKIDLALSSGDNDSTPLNNLAAAMHGIGFVCTSPSLSPLSQSLQSTSTVPPTLSTSERSSITSGEPVSAGTGVICTQAGKSLISLATALTALSAEALQADVKSLDSELIDSLPHKNASDIADSLRTLLEGSTQINPRRTGPGVLSSIINVPYAHGSALQDLSNAAVAVRAVLAHTTAPPDKNGMQPHLQSSALASSLSAMAVSFLQCAALSMQRSKLAIDLGLSAVPTMHSNFAHEYTNVQEMYAMVERKVRHSASLMTSSSQDDSTGALATANASFDAFSLLQKALNFEAVSAVVVLRFRETDSSAAAQATTDETPAAPTDSNQATDKKKKEKKKGNNIGFSLGQGTAMLRLSLEAAIAAESTAGTSSGAATQDSNSNGIEGQLKYLSLGSSSNDAASFDIGSALSTMHDNLDPLGLQLPHHLAVVNSILEANAVRRKPKVAKGARDFGPEQMAIREIAFNKIVSVFKRHGAVSIDTPVFELRETLMGKYGEDSKLIYDLADQGGELLSLRYDLTVPFARYVAVNGITNIKRYHIAKVYRRDQPQMTRGRFREFFQCDFDIAGVYSPMVPDSEVLKVLVEILGDLDLGKYEIKLNHRRLLDAMLDIAGVPPQKFRTICSAIDKLDKEPWEVVRSEMVDEKGLPGDVADKIGTFVVLKGEPRELLKVLKQHSHPLAQHPHSAAALDELSILFDFLDDMNALHPISFDLSLARGLDYYTGVIYEAVLHGGNVGSIAAGGRYDKLVGMFSTKEVPAVGVSIGIERVFSIMEGQMREKAAAANGTIRENETEVLVASIGAGLQSKRMSIASTLWAAGIKAEFGFKPNPKMADQLGYALKSGIPFMILFGEDEVAKGVVKLKDLDAGSEEEVNERELVEVVRERVKSVGERRIVYVQSNAGQE